MKRYFITLIILGFIGSETVIAQMPVVKVSPAEMYIELSEVGELFVRVENISGLRAYSVNLTYDSQKLRCLSITKATFFSGWSTFFYTQIDSNNNLLKVDEAILGLGHQSGSGDLFKIVFLALTEGDINLNFVVADFRDTLNNTIQVQTENGVVHIVNPTSVEELNAELNPNKITAYPNPFNSSTKIEYMSESNEETVLAIYSITGQKVFSLNASLLRGSTSFIWNGRDIDGNILPSGIYLLTAKTKNDLKLFKLIMLK